MAAFVYKALDAAGAERAGTLDAPDQHQAVQQLKRDGLSPFELSPAPAARARGAAMPRGLRLFAPAIRPRDLAIFTRQLATLLRAGVPLLRGLEILARQERNPTWQQVQRALADAVEAGNPLSASLDQHPRCFDRLYVNMVRAGEASGALDVVLDRLAMFREKRMRLQHRVRAAMVYPVIVLLVAAAILAALLVFVVPRFTLIFADLLKGAPLPLLTRGVIGVSEFARHHVLWGIGAGVAACGLWRMLRQRPPVRRCVDGCLLHLPLFGELLRRSIIVRVCQTLGTLLGSGVPILAALTLTRDTCGNLRVAAGVLAVHDQVKAGLGVAGPLEATRLFPPMMTSMVEVGEQSGQLPEMLSKVAEIYEGELDAAVAGLSSLIEPVMIVFLAVVVGTIVIALFLPIVRIVQLLS